MSDNNGWSSGSFPKIDFWKEGDPEIVTDDQLPTDTQDHTDTQDPVVQLTQEDAESLVDEAVEFYFSDDFITAVHMFSQALEVLTQTYEQKDLGLIWYYYGDSLLMMAKQRSTFLSGSDFEVDETIEGDIFMDDNEVDDNEVDEKQPAEETEAVQATDVAEGEEKDVQEEKDGAEETEGDENNAPASDYGDVDVAEDLELAWQILELARLALSDDDSKKKELSSVYLSLANVAVESENLEGAVKDFDECIKIRKETLGEDNRQVAEALYLKGLALASSQEHLEAAGHSLQEAKAIIEKNIEELKKEKDEEAVKDLTEILEELDEQITGITGEQVDPQMIRDIVTSSLEANQTGFAAPSGETEAVNDLTENIKRQGIKRKATEPLDDEDRILKKSKSGESEEN